MSVVRLTVLVFQDQHIMLLVIYAQMITSPCSKLCKSKLGKTCVIEISINI